MYRRIRKSLIDETIARIDSTCPTCGGERFLVTADPTESGEPGEPYQISCYNPLHPLVDDLQHTLQGTGIAVEEESRIPSLKCDFNIHDDPRWCDVHDALWPVPTEPCEAVARQARVRLMDRDWSNLKTDGLKDSL